MAQIKMKIKTALRKNDKNYISIRELAKQIRLKKTDVPEFEKVIASMKESGELKELQGRFMLSERPAKLTKAQIVKVNPTYGFARIEDTEDDIFIPGRKMLGAMPGDKVLVKVQKDRTGRNEGEVEKIVEVSDYNFTGIVQKNGGYLDIMPDKGARFPLGVVRGGAIGLREGQKVLAHLKRGGESHFDHKAVILTNFGDSQSAKNCCAAILAQAGITSDFSAEACEQAREIAKKGIHAKEIASRVDLRDEVILTIDSADTKDIDDAISLKKTADGFELGVHIADVSYYVYSGCPIDTEAYERGTSVYYANSVVPMLPVELSNGICSLNPGEDRLAFSAIISLDKQGNMLDYRFEKSVIRSNVKGVYKEINYIYDGLAKENIRSKYTEVMPTLEAMKELANLRIAMRAKKGGLDLESTESKIIIGENGHPTNIVPRETGFSERLIEEFMLLANEAAARFAEKYELPFLFRVHDKPSPQKIENLVEVLQAVGINTVALSEGATPKALFDILEQSKDTAYQKLVNNTLLRSMAKAIYSDKNIGHFGLVLEDYAHFTSPIRRYPDLLIHRIMSAQIMGMKHDTIEKKYRSFVGEAASQCSGREVRAMQTERDCEDCYKAEYMHKFIGESFEGIISSIAPHGIYVELPNTVEGLVRNDAMPAGEYDSTNKLCLVNKNTGKSYRIGDTVMVKVVGTDVSAGNIDFTIE